MTLQVQTARISFRGRDWLDITLSNRRGKRALGAHREIGPAFAPSAALLKHYLKVRTEQVTPELPIAFWEKYVESYIVEMRESYVQRRAAWTTLLGWERVVLLCFCTSKTQCHRHVLARDILPKLGAVYLGEFC